MPKVLAALLALLALLLSGAGMAVAWELKGVSLESLSLEPQTREQYLAQQARGGA